MKDDQFTKGRRAAGTLALSCLALVLCAYAPQSLAECKLGEGLNKNVLNIAMGEIAVPPETPKNATIHTLEIPIAHRGEWLVKCKSGSGSAWARVIKGNHLRNNVYTTNIDGIGLKFDIYMSQAKGYLSIPFDYPAGGAGLSMGSVAKMRIRLIKTDKNTGNGALEEGLYVTIASKDFPDDALRVIVSGRATTILTPSCTVAAIPTVQLGKVWKNLFSSVGSTAAEQNFSIKLNCREAGPEPRDVHLQMDAKPDASGAPGVIALDTTGVNAATGVGIQILDQDRKPVVYGKTSLVGKSKNGVYTLPFYARYYQTANQVTAGVANGAATLTLSYK